MPSVAKQLHIPRDQDHVSLQEQVQMSIKGAESVLVHLDEILDKALIFQQLLHQLTVNSIIIEKIIEKIILIFIMTSKLRCDDFICNIVYSLMS